jgi:hypothetical protein
VSSRQPNSSVRVKAQFDHVCCWQKEWPYMLKSL